jgi:hypothetical protein
LSNSEIKEEHIDYIKRKYKPLPTEKFEEAIQRMVQEFGRKETIKEALILVANADKVTDEIELSSINRLFGDE